MSARLHLVVALVWVFGSWSRVDAQSPLPPQPVGGTHEHHVSHDQDKPPEKRPAQPESDLPSFIPRPTDDDRTAAFPDVRGHAVHDRSMHYFALFDQLEWQTADENGGINLDAKGWIGGDRDRLWLRAEGRGEDGRVGDAQAHVLYGRQFARWWDVVGGMRQDFRPGPAQTWAAFGVQGLSPYRFEIEATAYIGASGRTHARFEVEYELLVTNRLVLQPHVEADVFGKRDAARLVGAGLSTTDLGFRLRYEWRRELAPYVGVSWHRKYGGTADFAKASGESAGGARFIAGVRAWF